MTTALAICMVTVSEQLFCEKSKHKCNKSLFTLPLFSQQGKKTSAFRMEIPSKVLPI